MLLYHEILSVPQIKLYFSFLTHFSFPQRSEAYPGSSDQYWEESPAVVTVYLAQRRWPSADKAEQWIDSQSPQRRGVGGKQEWDSYLALAASHLDVRDLCALPLFCSSSLLKSLLVFFFFGGGHICCIVVSGWKQLRYCLSPSMLL